MGRMEKVNQQVKREVGKIIQQDLSDPRVEFVTVTEVDVSPDLHNAKVYFSVLGDGASAEKAKSGLSAAKGMIRHLVAKRMQIRRIPDFTFHFDKSIEASVRIDQTIKEINDEFQESHSDDQGE